MTSEKLRQLPAVFEIVAQLRAQSPHLPDARLTQAARDGINHLRTKILDDPSTEIEVASILEHATSSLNRSYAPVEVINATGVVLHTNLGRAPLSRRAIDAVINAARSSDLEYDLEAGKRASRNRLLSKPLAELTHTEAGFIVNNCAAALILALAGLGGRATALARSQIIEIGGGFRLPDIMRVSGVRLHEVGTTNRTRLSDYEEALEQGADSILWMHRSNFELSGFTEEPSLAELSKLATDHVYPSSMTWELVFCGTPPNSICAQSRPSKTKQSNLPTCHFFQVTSSLEGHRQVSLSETKLRSKSLQNTRLLGLFALTN